MDGLRRLLIWLAALILFVPASFAVAEEGEGEDGEGDDDADDGDDGRGAREDRSGRSGRDGDGRAAEMEEAAEEFRDFQDNQTAERQAFLDAQEHAHSDLHGGLEAARSNFTVEQQAARDAFLAENHTGEEIEDFHEAQADAREEFARAQAEEHREFHEGVREEREGFNESQREERQEFIEELREEHAPERRQVGEFRRADTAAVGAFVTFTFNGSEGTLSEYTLQGELLFDSIDVEPFIFEEMKVEGPITKIEGDGSEIKVHDNPSAFLKIEAKDDATVSFDLADGYTATLIRTHVVSVEGPNVTALILLGGSDDADDDEGEDASRSAAAIGNASVDVTLGDGAHLIVRAFHEAPVAAAADEEDDGEDRDEDGERRHPPRHERDRKIREAHERGAIGAEIRVERVAETGEDAVDVSAFGNLSATVAPTDGRVTIILDTPGHGEGRAVVLTLDKAALRFADGHGLVVEFDGEPVAQADDYDDVLDPNDDAGEVEYVAIVGRESVELLVSVPSFSPHTLTVESLALGPIAVEAPPSVIAGILGAVIVTAAAAALMFRRPS